jgi:choline-sulfatase
MSFFEPSVRVPLIVRRAGAPGSRRVRSPVSLLDLAPTLVELAGAPPLPELDGVSLVPALAGEAAGPGRAVLAEYHAEGVQAPSAMIRAGSHKLIASAEDPDLLFDLDADPLELTDLAGDPAYEQRVRELRAKLSERLDFGEIDRRVRASQRERHLVASALRTGKYTSWDYEPRVDASMQYVRSREDLYELQREARLDSGVHPEDLG